MTVPDAFRLLTNRRTNGDEHKFEQAQIVIYRALHALSGRLAATHEERQESGSRCFERLLRVGPRAIDLDVEKVEAYLWKMLKYDDLDRKRRRHRETTIGSAGGQDSRSSEPVDSRNPESISIEEQEQREDLELAAWAVRFVFEDLKEALATRLKPRYQDGFKRSVAELKALVLGTESFDEVVSREFPKLTVQAKNRIYQRHCRAREQYLDWLEDEMPSGNFSSAQRAALKGLIAQLRR